MTAKQLKKQLFLSIIAVLATLGSLSSATYAWFAFNSTVTASGLQINAAMDGVNFEITNNVGTDGEPDFVVGQTTATVNVAAGASLIPIHPETPAVYSGNPKAVAEWHHAFSDTYDNAKIDAVTSAVTMQDIDFSKGYGYCTNADNQAFALAVRFFIRLNPDTTGEDVVLENIKATNLKIEDGTGTNLLSNAVYLLVAGPDGVSQISTAAVTGGETTLGTIPAESGVLVNEITPTVGEYKSIILFAFFDGKDKDCKSSNFSADNIAISVEFVGAQATKTTVAP